MLVEKSMQSNMLDLTQTLVQGIPDWDGCCGFNMKQLINYPQGARVQALEMPNGIGTHMDAPNHFIENACDIAGLALKQLLGPGVVIDVSQSAHAEYALCVNDILEFEKKYGMIPEHSIAIIATGWGKKWNQARRYRNANADGVMRFPVVSKQAAEFLLTRNINGLAIDTLSPDWPDSQFPVHHTLLGAGKFIIENIFIHDDLPPSGFKVLALPIKIEAATEAPCRVIAMLDA